MILSGYLHWSYQDTFIALITIPSLLLSRYLHCSYQDTFIALFTIPSLILSGYLQCHLYSNEQYHAGIYQHVIMSWVLVGTSIIYLFFILQLPSMISGTQQAFAIQFWEIKISGDSLLLFPQAWNLRHGVSLFPGYLNIVLSYIFETFYCTEDIKYCLQLDAQFSSYWFKLKPKMCKTRSVCSVHCQYLWPACITFENAADW